MEEQDAGVIKPVIWTVLRPVWTAVRVSYRRTAVFKYDGLKLKICKKVKRQGLGSDPGVWNVSFMAFKIAHSGGNLRRHGLEGDFIGRDKILRTGAALNCTQGPCSCSSRWFVNRYMVLT